MWIKYPLSKRSESCLDRPIMPLSEQDKSAARDALALALELNEPETMIEGLRRLCAKRLAEAHLNAFDRDRWQSAVNALASVASELERANRPQTRANDAQGAPSDASAA